jgi:hypothetical protein
VYVGAIYAVRGLSFWHINAVFWLRFTPNTVFPNRR